MIELAQPPAFGPYTPLPMSSRFTPRQRELIDLLVRKKSIVEAAKDLGISIHTARAQVRAIALQLPNPHGLPALKLILSYFERLSAREA